MSVLKLNSTGPDVAKLQRLLNQKLIPSPCLPGNERFGPLTDKAVRAFQKQAGLKLIDGEVGKDTWKALGVQPPAGASAGPGTSAGGPPLAIAEMWADWSFPFAFVPSDSWKSGSRYFGAPRSNGRKHGGCDLYAAVGTPIYAVDDGEFLAAKSVYFYYSTHAISVRHGQLVVRYGEIRPGSCYVPPDRKVKKGQKIAEVGELIYDTPGHPHLNKAMTSVPGSGVTSNMLHFELYAGTAQGSLTTGTPPYKRRADLLNPTTALDEMAKNLPDGLSAPGY